MNKPHARRASLAKRALAPVVVLALLALVSALPPPVADTGSAAPVTSVQKRGKTAPARKNVQPAEDGILNGSFEEVNPEVITQQNMYFPPVDADTQGITSWQVRGEVNYMYTDGNQTFNCVVGNACVDLNGDGKCGSISQTFSTSPGWTYQLNWSRAHYGGNPQTKTYAVVVAGEQTVRSFTDPKWDGDEVRFVAKGNRTTVTFMSLENWPEVKKPCSSYGVIIDDVKVGRIG